MCGLWVLVKIDSSLECNEEWKGTLECKECGKKCDSVRNVVSSFLGFLY